MSALRTFHSSKMPLIFCQVLSSHKTSNDITGEPASMTAAHVNGGHINELAVNEKAQSLLGNVQVTWRLNRQHSDNQTAQRNVFLLSS